MRASGPPSTLPGRFACFKRTGGNRQGATEGQRGISEFGRTFLARRFRFGYCWLISTNALGEDHAMTNHSRRTLLMGASAALGTGLFAPSTARAQGAALGDSVKALVFDVFGTVVNW